MAEFEDGVVVKVEDHSPVLCLESYELDDEFLSLSRPSSPNSRVTRSGNSEGRTPKKRARKNDFCLDTSEEEAMLEFLRDNPLIWNYKLIDYRRTEKKSKIWEDQAKLMGKTAAHLQGWYKSLRDTHTRLHKKKFDTHELTEREQWIKTGFGFLKSVMRHRAEPYSNVKVTPAGDQSVDEEDAEADYQEGLDDDDSSSSTALRTKRRRIQGNDDQITMNSLHNKVQDYPVFMDSLKNRVNDSSAFMGPSQSRDPRSPAFVDLFPNTAFEPPSLSRIYQQQIVARGVFANYVRDSLITMSERKYKKARSAINKILTAAMEDDAD